MVNLPGSLPKNWSAFGAPFLRGFLAASYLREMRQPAPQRLLAVLALLSRSADFSVGCYCADASHCHRSLLERLLREHGASISKD